MKKLLFIITLCLSFAVNAVEFTPNGLMYAAPVEQTEKAYSVILANDSTETMAVNTVSTINKFENATMKENRPLNYRFISSNILSVESVLRSGLSPLKPDKPQIF